MRDTLFLLTPGFTDPVVSEQPFYCAHCALIEGVLASFPDLGGKIDVRRVAFPRPRRDVIAMVGEEHQSLPLLVLSDDAPDGLATRVHGELRFISDKHDILRALSLRHGFPEAHP